MTRNRIVVALLAALLVAAGGFFSVNQAVACGNCPLHAKADQAKATSADAGSCHARGTAEAEVSTADVKMVTGKACCASGQGAGQASAQLTGAKATCSAWGDGKHAEVKAACAVGAKADLAKADGQSCELMTAEATLAKLAHCGIDINAASTEVLAAKLAAKGCAGYSEAQWASMIDAAKGLDAEKTKVVLAGVKNDPRCSRDACPMTQVAKELASADQPNKN